MARADHPLSVPGELGPLVPVIEKAGAAAPGDRLSAEAFAQGIAAVARQLRAPLPLPLAGTSVFSDGVFCRETTELAGGRRRPAEPGITILVEDLAIMAPEAVGGPLGGGEPGATAAGMTVTGPGAPAAGRDARAGPLRHR